MTRIDGPIAEWGHRSCIYVVSEKLKNKLGKYLLCISAPVGGAYTGPGMGNAVDCAVPSNTHTHITPCGAQRMGRRGAFLVCDTCRSFFWQVHT